MLLCAPGAVACRRTSVCGMFPGGALPRLLLLRHILLPSPYSSRLRCCFELVGTPSFMLDKAKSRFRMRGSVGVGYASAFRIILRWPEWQSFLAMVCLLAALCLPPLVGAQDQEEVKGAPAEPADAQEIREQIAAVQK